MPRLINPKIAFFLLFLFIPSLHASFNKSLWPMWQVNNPTSQQKISHQKWQIFLTKYVITNDENINLVDYPHIHPEDLSLLKSYIKEMSHINIAAYNRNEQLAFWINLYNALIVQTVANYYPVANIQEINTSPGLFSVGPWGSNIVTINGMLLTLDSINNRIIRPIWNDPRTLYAMNDATMGAANLSKEAYVGSRIQEQLNAAAQNYINSLRGAQVIEGKLILSKIYDWYEEDYGDSKQYVIEHLLQFAQEPLISQLKHINNIDNYVYNWHINSPSRDE